MNFLFDLGNVVLDWNPPKFIAEFKISDTEKQTIKDQLYGHPDWLLFDRGVLSEIALIEKVSNRTNISTETVSYCIEETKKSLVPINRSVELIEKLHKNGEKLYILSNMPIEMYQHFKHYPFFDYFEDKVISGYIDLIKPDPAIFTHTLEKFALNASDTLFIDDSLPNIETATKMGFKCVHFKRTDACYTTIEEYMK